MAIETKFDSQRPDLTIVIPNWDGAAVLGQCLESLVRHTGSVRSEIVIFDNGSIDGSIELAQSYMDRLDLRLIPSPINIGYAAACNRAAENSQAPYLLLFNNDAELAEDLEPALEYLDKHPNVAVCQGPLLTRDGGWVDSVGTLLTRWGFLSHLAVGKPVSELPPGRFVFSVKGTAMFVRRQALGEFGLFDDEAFAYFEETDLCWRLQTMGWDVTYTQLLPKVLHQGAYTAQRLPNICEYHLFKNRLQSIVKNAQRRTLVTMLPRHLVIVFASCISGCFNGSPGRILNVLHAGAWNLRNARKTFRLRQDTQTHRRRSDRQIFATVAVEMKLRAFLLQGADYRRYRQHAG